MESPTLLPPRTEMLRAIQARDAAYDGVFFMAVRTTGVFCRPSCPSQPHPANLEFFGSARECVHAGYRPCQRCRPLETCGTPPAWVAALVDRLARQPALKPADLRDLGVSPERARRWFQHHYGMTFAAWCRGQRLSSALCRLRAGDPLDDVACDSGYASHSGFREAFVRAFGAPPGRARTGIDGLIVAMFDSPLGPLLAGTSETGLCLLEFADLGRLEATLVDLRRRFRCPLVPGDHPRLGALRTEVSEYFAGRRRDFTVALDPRGTPFQQRVWRELRNIPYGATLSYEALARGLGQPSARRAVARANGANRLCLLIPCHRVIGKDGSLTGYGGGLWRKRLLLELEQGRIPPPPPEPGMGQNRIP